MVILFNPKACSPLARRFPLSVMHLGAMLNDDEYVIVDGNVDPTPVDTIANLVRSCNKVELLAVSVMPGPQIGNAVPQCKKIKKLFPHLPVMWGGYFPSMHTRVTLKSDFVDYVVRGQGEQTLVEFLQASRNGGGFEGIRGLSYKRGREIIDNPPRPMISPNDLPERLPYHKIQPRHYLQGSFLGKRTAAHHTSMGCPFGCNFCGVISVYGSREKMAAPARTEAALRHLKTVFGVDSIQFFDNNFFLGEDHVVELCERLAPLGLKWWCEARIDILLRYRASTWQKLKAAGCTMIFFGAESGANQSLREMNKNLTREQIVAMAHRAQQFDIIPEFSFMFGNPHDPLGDALVTIDLIYQLKAIDPRCEIIIQHFTPTPQRRGSYGNVDAQNPYPDTLEEWATPPWIHFASHHNPTVPWLRADLLSWLRNFETVVQCRWPTIQDFRLTPVTRKMLQALAGWRYRSRVYNFPIELKIAKRAVALRNPRIDSL
jgi:hypothetical protein